MAHLEPTLANSVTIRNSNNWKETQLLCVKREMVVMLIEGNVKILYLNLSQSLHYLVDIYNGKKYYF